jgi:polar amino acid transport system substrate-binding protein
LKSKYHTFLLQFVPIRQAFDISNHDYCIFTMTKETSRTIRGRVAAMASSFGRYLLVTALLSNALAATAAESPVPYRIVSGDLRPFAADNHPAAPGMLVELVEQMASRAQHPVKVEFFPWARAVGIALGEPRCAVLPLTRTPEREAKFQWLVKLYQQRFAFITPAAKRSVNNLNDARQLKIVVLRGSPNVAQLLNHQISAANIVEESSVEMMLKDLDTGIVDAIYGGDVINMETVRSSGRKTQDYYVGMMLESGDIWLASSGGFTRSEIDALQDAYNTLKKDGTYSRLLKKYGISE